MLKILNLNRLIAGLMILLAGSIQIASAQWSENFDSLLTNNNVAPFKGWETWDQAAGANSMTSSTVSTSAPNSIKITGTSDTIRRYQGYNGGHWEYKSKVYVPSTASGRSWFILMNKYVHGVHNNQDWSLQIAFNAATNAIYSQEANITGTLIEDAWFELRVDINIATNLAKIYVNNVLFAQHAWVGPNGINGLYRLECLDLYAETPTSVAYYDDMQLNNLSDCCSDLINIAQDGGSTALGIPLGQLFKPVYTGHACDIITGIETFTASAYDLYIVNAPGGVMPTDFASNYIYRALNQTASNTSPSGPVNGTINAVNSQAILYAGVEYAIIAVPQNNMIAWHTLYVGTGGKGQYMYNNTTWITMTDRHFSFRITGLKSKTVVSAGLPDNYATPYDNVYRSPAFNAVYPGAVWRKFDEEDNNKWLGHTFTSLPGSIKRARLTFTAKTEPGSDATNDSISLGLLNNPSSPAPPPYWQWTRELDLLPESGGVWNTNGTTTFTLDLHNLPGGGNVIGQMNATGMLDVWIQDDTNVDNMVLELWTCPANPNPFGGPWVTVGVATLAHDTVANALVVNNIGSSGNDGVAVDLGQGWGASWKVQTQNDPRNADVGVKAEAILVDNETRAEETVSVAIEGMGGHSQVIPNLGSSGLDGVDITLLTANGQVVARRLHSPLVYVHTYGKSTPKLYEKPVRGRAVGVADTVALVGEVEMDAPSNVAIGGEVFANVSQIMFEAAVVGPGRHIKHVAIKLRSTGETQVRKFRPAFFDVFCDFSTVGEWDKSTSFGADGLSQAIHTIGQETPLGTAVKSSWNLKENVKRVTANVVLDADANLDGEIDVDAGLNTSVTSDYQTGANHMLGRIAIIRRQFGFFDVFADLTPLGATSNIVEIYSGSTLVATLPGLPNDVGTSSRFITKKTFGQLAGKKFWEAEFPANTEFQISGSIYLGDKLVITGANATTEFVRLLNIEMTGENCNAITVSNLTTETEGITIGGIVTLQDFEADAYSGPVTFRIRPRDGFGDIETHVVELGPDGEYSFETLLHGEYDVTCEGSHWLRKMIPVTIPDIAGGGQVEADYSLTNGDCDGDNEITLVDAGIVAAAFGSSAGDPNWNPLADLDGDGEVNILDYGIIGAHFGESGDE